MHRKLLLYLGLSLGFVYFWIATPFLSKVVCAWLAAWLVWQYFCFFPNSIDHTIRTMPPLCTRSDVFKREGTELKQLNTLIRSPLFEMSPEASDEMDLILAMLIQKFVSSWSMQLMPEKAISNIVEEMIRDLLSNVINRLSTVDPADLLVRHWLPLLTDHLRLYVEAEELVVGRKAVSFTDPLELSRKVAARYNHGRLHQAVSLSGNPIVAQKKYLRQWINSMLSILLPEYSNLSPLALTFAIELIVGKIMLPLVAHFSNPDFFNLLIIRASGTILQRRRKIRRLKHAIRKMSTHSQVGQHKLGLKDTQHAFDQYIREIKRISNISDARRLRTELLVQMKQLDQSIPFSSELTQYCERLKLAVRAVEKRITTLSGAPIQQKISTLSEQIHSLMNVLNDPAGVSCFIEFMESKNQSQLVHFWLVIEGLKTSQDDPLNAYVLAPFSDIASDHDDFATIYEKYFTDEKLGHLNIPKALSEPIRLFINCPVNNLPNDKWVEARNAMLMIQNAVYITMERDYFNEFKNSEIYYRFLAQDVVSEHKSSFHPNPVTPIQLCSHQTSIHSVSSSSKSLQSWPSQSVSVQSLLNKQPTNIGPEDDDEAPFSDEEEVMYAPPGDLQISESIEALDTDLQELREQFRVLKTLLNKAEITADVKQQEILSKGYRSLEQIIHRKERQRAQYLSQEEDSKLYNRTRITIDNYKQSRDDDGNEFAVYVMRVERIENGDVSSGWVVARRYREFNELHKQLKRECPQVGLLKFPQKTIISSPLSTQTLEFRRKALEQYLRSILEIAEVCDGKTFRVFLSQQNLTVPKLHDTKDIKIRWKAMFEVLGFDMSSASSAASEESSSPFARYICEFFVELFGLNDPTKTQWMPMKTCMLMLEQLFGGTLEKKVRERIYQSIRPERLLEWLQKVRKKICSPSGLSKTNNSDGEGEGNASYADKFQLKAEASFMLASMFPGYTPDVAAKKIFRVIQNQTLNTHIVFVTLDAILNGLLDGRQPQVKKI
ncbi:sorting nexin Snx12 [Schizosaccharomyces japonicus yFS275]|uniref:Sorting nexin Snx12 n=1 Tax=Schizosaccharomyces japonicus (strain yFS275 / FY16936) TaxID=402676 RepID=B6K693_SCHJY|nr:sorting nexin Snx12 [Schizosaccharomyces japonicus yFS275]EEB09047.1 sorting nexin Snx12 [Schizosaccharomyces japonicus yFS275]